jgi:hypothetical protein
MKKLVASAAAALMLLAGSLTAQERTEETTTTTDSTGTHTVQVVRIAKREDIRVLKNMVTVDPFKLITLFNISYYRALSPSVAVGATIQAPFHTEMTNESSGVGLHVDALYFPTGKVFRGFNLGGKLAYDMVTYDAYESNGPVERTDHPVSLVGFIGWNWWPMSEMVAGVTLGAEYQINEIDRNPMSWDPLFFRESKGLFPYAGLKIGFAW